MMISLAGFDIEINPSCNLKKCRAYFLHTRVCGGWGKHDVHGVHNTLHDNRTGTNLGQRKGGLS